MTNYINVTRDGNQLVHKYIDDNGNRLYDRVDFQPKLYLPDYRNPDSKFRSRNRNIPLKEKVYDSITEFYSASNKYKDLGGYGVYGNIAPTYQFLAQQYPEQIDFQYKHMRVFYFDIETAFDVGIFPSPDEAKYPVLTISIYDSLENIYTIIGTKEYTRPLDDNEVYIKCHDEKELLETFLDVWKYNDYPDLVVGWNSEQFDIPYIVNRMKKVIPQQYRDLSPIRKIITRKRKGKYDKEYVHATIEGINHIDMMKYYEKFPPRAKVSFSLDFIANDEIGFQKIKYDGNLMDLYEQDFNKYCHYNKVDVELMVKINDKIKLLELVMTIAYLARVNPEDTYSPVKTWDAMTYNYLLPKNIMIEPKGSHEKEKYDGAFVMEPVPGLYKWVVSADVNSMYPNLIRSLNLGPETILEEDNGNCTVSASGHFFDKTKQSVYSEMVTHIYDKRKDTKKVLKTHKQDTRNVPLFADFFNQIEQFNKIKFVEDTHTYYINGKEQTSGTSFIGRFKEKFDMDGMSKRVAAKRGVPQQVVIDEWDRNRDISCEKGTAFHKYIEDSLNGITPQYDSHKYVIMFGKDVIKEKYDKMIPQWDEFVCDHINKLQPVTSELILGDENLGICGMADQIFFNLETHKFEIWDWKTNKAINTYSRYKKKFKDPISYLDECELNSYSLQLSLYRYILEKNTNIKFGPSSIVWFNENNDTYEVFQCKYLKNDIEKLLEQ